MANSFLSTALSEKPIPTNWLEFDAQHGAALQFLGVVRAREDGESIAGILYSAYKPMAAEILESLGTRASAKFGEHTAHIIHRLGFVPAGEPSLLLRVTSKHSAPAIEALTWYLAEVKSRVPIWKEPLKEAP